MLVAATLLGCLTFSAAAAAASSDTYLSIIAGIGPAGLPTPGPAITSALNHPRGVAVDPSTGDLYIADFGNSEIEKVTPQGALSIVAGTDNYGAPTPGPATGSDLDNPTGVAVSSAGDVYIADPYNNEVEKVTPQGALSIVAGTGAAGPPVQGLASSSPLDEPYGVAVDSAGDLFIADYGNNVVEEVSPGGQLSIIAGTGTYGLPTAGAATQSELGSPSDVAVSSAGDVYIADPFNRVVEEVTPQGALSIVAGTGATGAPTPGLATQSPLGLPHGVALDPGTGDLYIADYGNSEVEQVTPQGILSVVAGTGTAGAPTPGPAAQSELDQPLGVDVNPDTGLIYVSDTSNNEIEQIGPPPATVGGTPPGIAPTPPSQRATGATCPDPSGDLTGVRVGPVPLGITRTQARKALPQYSVTRAGFDRFCLAGGPGILAGYPSARLLRTFTARQRAELRGRVVLVLTANHHYAFDHIAAGAPVTRERRRLNHATRFRIGGDTWYVLRTRKTTSVIEVQGGKVAEVGIANHTITATHTQQRRLLASF